MITRQKAELRSFNDRNIHLSKKKKKNRNIQN